MEFQKNWGTNTFKIKKLKILNLMLLDLSNYLEFHAQRAKNLGI